MARYGWVITFDAINTLREDEVCPGAPNVGTVGPHDCPFDEGEIIAKGQPFMMFDDDENFYYAGYILGEYEGLEPLWDFGTADAGCTLIKLYSYEDYAWPKDYV